MSVRRTQLLFVAGAVILTAALYLAPRNVVRNQHEADDVTSTTADSFGMLLAEAKSQLKGQEAESLVKLEEALASSGGTDTTVLGQLGRAWDNYSMPVIAAHYYEEIAKVNPGETQWLNAAYRYFDAFKMVGDSLLRQQMVEKAISSYKEVIRINPENLDAKTDLGVCYAEGTSNPMEGIMLLREVVSRNPGHENAQYNLGILSVRSGQLDKAVERFSTVLTINPSRTDARYLLGRCYAQMGKKEEALASLRKVKEESKDPQLIEESNTLINQLNSNQ